MIPHGIDPVRIAAALDAAATRAEPHDIDNTTNTVTVVTVASHRDAKNYPNLLHAVRAAIDARRGHPAGDRRRRPQSGRPRRTRTHTRPRRRRDVRAEHRRRAWPRSLPPTSSPSPATTRDSRSWSPRPWRSACPWCPPPSAGCPRWSTPRWAVSSLPAIPAALGAALAELATNPGLRADMSTAARRQLLAWTLDDVIAAHLALYTDIAARR